MHWRLTFTISHCFATLSQRSGKTYGPPSSKRLIYFVDDLNMPFIEEYGTQTPIALLRQHMDYNGYGSPRYGGLHFQSVIVRTTGLMTCRVYPNFIFFVSFSARGFNNAGRLLVPSLSSLRIPRGRLLVESQPKSLRPPTP